VYCKLQLSYYHSIKTQQLAILWYLTDPIRLSICSNHVHNLPLSAKLLGSLLELLLVVYLDFVVCPYSLCAYTDCVRGWLCTLGSQHMFIYVFLTMYTFMVSPLYDFGVASQFVCLAAWTRILNVVNVIPCCFESCIHIFKTVLFSLY